MKTAEIYDEDNSIIIDDQYDTTDFTFYPEDKKFTVSRSVKEDCFYSNQTIEYKISVNPIEIYMRTLESSHEPPLEYSIRDGVVLESELKKKDNILFPDRIERLKKEVEWEKISLFGNYEVNLYILSKHPEIISKEDYRKFLRQSIEKIKMGVLKVEEAIKKDTHGLQLHTGEYGKSIWYPDTEAEKKEMDEYYDLPEEKREGTKYAKKLEYVNKFNDSLFKEDSPKYVGISDYEFKTATEIVEYIEKLLNKKETPPKKEEHQASTGNKAKWIPVIVLTIIALSWGIWTAIGVFILGSIITNMLFNK